MPKKEFSRSQIIKKIRKMEEKSLFYLKRQAVEGDLISIETMGSVIGSSWHDPSWSLPGNNISVLRWNKISAYKFSYEPNYYRTHDKLRQLPCVVKGMVIDNHFELYGEKGIIVLVKDQYFIFSEQHATYCLIKKLM